MPQARGTQFVFALLDEDTYGQDPASPVGKKIYSRGTTLGSSQGLHDDPTLLNERARAEPIQGNIDAGGDIPVTQNAESMSYLLKHALGQVVTGRPVSNQPTNVTGVVVEYAEDTCSTGDGTLAYTNTGTLLSWKASGDTTGATQDVSAGGVFTLESGSANESLTVTVTAGSLPGADQSDTDITVVAAYEHRFTIGDLPIGFTGEKDFGANISGTGRYEKVNGTRIGAVAWKFPQEGHPEAVFSCKAASSTLAASPLDATLTDPGHTGFSSFSAAVKEGGATIATLVEADINLDNGLDESGYVLGSGSRAQLPEGFATVGGRVKGLFQDATLLNKAINNTESSLEVTLSRGDGWGTASNEAVVYQVQQMKYERTGVPIDGPAGVFIDLPFKAYRSGTDNGLLVKVRNQLATL